MTNPIAEIHLQIESTMVRCVQAARYSDGDAWFRVCGYGLSVKSEARVYSDRNLRGAVRWIWVPFVGRRLVRWLRPDE